MLDLLVCAVLILIAVAVIFSPSIIALVKPEFKEKYSAIIQEWIKNGMAKTVCRTRTIAGKAAAVLSNPDPEGILPIMLIRRKTMKTVNTLVNNFRCASASTLAFIKTNLKSRISGSVSKQYAVDYEREVRKLIESDIRTLLAEDVNKARQEILAENKKAIQQLVEEHRKIIDTIVASEKLSISERVDAIRRSILKDEVS